MQKIVLQEKLFLQKLLKITGIMLFIFEIIFLYFIIIIFPVANDEFQYEPYYVDNFDGYQKINSETIIEDINNDRENKFLILEEKDPMENRNYNFSFDEFLQIAQASTEEIWERDFDEWHIVDIYAHGTLCETGEINITDARFVFETEIDSDTGKETIIYETHIYPQYEYIYWRSIIQIRKRKAHYQDFNKMRIQSPDDNMKFFFPEILDNAVLDENRCVRYVEKYNQKYGRYYWEFRVYDVEDHPNYFLINAKTGITVQKYYFNASK